MADYAGAVAALTQRMIDNWTTTPIIFQNKSSEYDPGAHTNTPWVYFEVIGNGSKLRASGMPGNLFWIYSGLIAAHVYVPINSGAEVAQQYAFNIGEVFRAQGLYSDGNGSMVRTWSPRTDGGDGKADDGNWYVVTCRIPFDYWHRG